MEAGSVERTPSNATRPLHTLFRLDTRFIHLRLVEELDYPLLYELRISERARYLNTIDGDPLKQREYIRSARQKALLGEELYYAISAHPNINKVAGFIRLADLNNKRFFSFHSLIVSPVAPAFLALDAIFTTLQIGFDVLGHERSDTLTVRLDNERMRALHRTMGILTEDRTDSEWVYLSATRKKYRSRREFFRRFGFGLENAPSI